MESGVAAARAAPPCSADGVVPLRHGICFSFAVVMKDGEDLGIVCDSRTLEVLQIRPQSAAAAYNQKLAEEPL
eukprot:4943038-Alexandrium_andersonii.AAC.1